MTSILLRGTFAASIFLAFGTLATSESFASEKGSQTKTKQFENELTFWEKLQKKNEQRVEEFRQKREARMKELSEAREQRKLAAANGKDKPAANAAKSTKTVQAKPAGNYTQLISKYAAQHGVPYNLARAVVQVESSFRPNVTGAAGEIGLMQIKLATARGMGYKGSRQALYSPANNLYWGMKYLGRAHQLSGGTVCGTILKYNAGHYAKRNNPVSTNYCRKVRNII